MIRRLTALLLMLAVLLPFSDAHSADRITYDADVKPILREHCFACHNQDDATASLALDTFEGLTAGGAGGEVVSAGDLDGSRLWKLVTHEEEPKMPPGDKLPKQQLDTLKAWIEGGLLKDAGSKPIKKKKSAIATIDASKLGKPVGKPAMPEQLLHEPVLWTQTPGPVEALATSPWAPLAAIGWQRQVSLYHTQTHELLGIIPYLDGVPKVVRFSRDGSLVLVAGGRHAAAGSATLFDVKTGARLATLGDELDIVLAADISPDLGLVALGGPKKRVKVYRVADGELQYQITKHTEWITALGFSPDGKFLATADRNGGALIWQAAAGHERADLRGHKGAITAIDWRADSAMVATASEDGTVKLWDPAGKQVKSVSNRKGFLSVRFAQDGNFVTAGRDNHVRTWKPDGAAIADLGQMPGIALAASFSHDGKSVLASDYSGEVRAIDVATKKSIATLHPNPLTLSHRLANAVKSLQEVQQLVSATKKSLKASLAEVEQGKSAHEAHAAKLSEAESKLAQRRKDYDQALAYFEEHQQKHDALSQTRAAAESSLAEAKKLLESALADEKKSADTEKEKSSNDEDGQPTATSESSKIVELRKQVEAAQSAFESARTDDEQSMQMLPEAMAKKEQAASGLRSAEVLLAQVTNETAGLPDLKQLGEAHKQAKSELAAKQQQLEQAEQEKTKIVALQERFNQAMTQLTAKMESRQTEQQELAKQTGRLEAEHSQAAAALAVHRESLAVVEKQLKGLQAQLADLRKSQAKLKETESNVATQLRDVRQKLLSSQEAAESLQQRQKDFKAAQKLREKYSPER